MKNNSIRTVVATGIGAALFIIIGMFVNIPIFGNTSIQLQYAVQALSHFDQHNHSPKQKPNPRLLLGQ